MKAVMWNKLGMNRFALSAAASLALLTVTSTGALAVVQPGSPVASSGTFETTLAPSTGIPSGPIVGRLMLHLAPDGVVQGTFRDLDSARIHTVTGGVRGREIWLNLGYLGDLHIDGSIDNGKIVGYTFLGGQQYRFDANPVADSLN